MGALSLETPLCASTLYAQNSPTISVGSADCLLVRNSWGRRSRIRRSLGQSALGPGGFQSPAVHSNTQWGGSASKANSGRGLLAGGSASGNGNGLLKGSAYGATEPAVGAVVVIALVPCHDHGARG